MFKSVVSKVNFPELEREIFDFWQKEGIVEKYLHKNDKSTRRFSFFDGPITANNPMGVHHAWGRTYKDLWQRFFNMKGYRERFQNGFDCQGLWVEVEVEKELGIKNKRDIEDLIPADKKASIAKFVELCKERVVKFAKIQTEQSKRLGYFMDWDNSYYTASDENNYMIWYFLKICHSKGWIYKGKDSVPWCPRCETAISQHEILTEDYRQITHESVYLKLPIIGREKEHLLVWTTTPWTIPANIVVVLDQEMEYSQVADKKGELFWLARQLIDKVFAGCEKKVKTTVKGKELVGLKYKGPFDYLPAIKEVAGQNPDTFHTVIATDQKILPVSVTEGTGLVHTAVSAGEEDFKLGKKLGLPMIPVIKDNADYLDGLGFLSAKNAKNNPRLILDYLKKNNWSWKIEDYTHRYPVCWRCKEELVWKVTDEWYIAMDRPEKIEGRRSKIETENKKTLRERMVEVAKKIRWIPDFGLERELDWLKNMHDWLISKKNRYWGLALPVWECEKCGYFEVIGSKEELKEKAVSGWQEFEGKSPHKPQIDEVKIRCDGCGETISRIEPVGNPWLDAGIISFSTLVDPKTNKLSYITDREYWKKWFPADFITESFPGQFKNWFYSLIVMSTVLEGTPPFRTVLGFATLLGEDGRPMHKSWGNAIEFNEGAEKIGVDVMRWMYVIQKPTDNLLFGYKKADEVRRKFHLTLWNIYNFFVTYTNIDGFKKSKPQLKSQNLSILDRWIMSKLNQLIKTVTGSLNSYDAHTASMAIEEFVNDLSTWYVRRSRDRVGPTAENDSDKIACHATLYEVLVTLAKLLAPFTPFVAEEIYQNLTSEESVHLASWPEVKDELIDKELDKEMKDARSIVVSGHAFRKSENIKVRQPLKKLKVQNSKFKIGRDLGRLIKDELNIKEIEINLGDGDLGVELETKLTPKLIAEGEARELIRKIQLKRKELGCKLTDKVKITLPKWPIQFSNYIKRKTLAETIIRGDGFLVERL